MRNAAAIVVFVVFVVLSGCPKDAPAPPPAEAVRLDPAPPAPIVPPTPIVIPNREILVGGCMDDCDRPAKALTHVIEAALSRDPSAVKRYVDTSLLVHDGRDHGKEWGELYLAGKLDERRESIEKWLKDWLTWVDRVLDPADLGKAPAVTVIEENQHRYVVDYRHPDLSSAGRATGGVWRIVLKTRGLEWLVAEIQERAERK